MGTGGEGPELVQLSAAGRLQDFGSVIEVRGSRYIDLLRAEARVYVEDDEAFTTPWDAMQLYRRVEAGSLIEVACAENNVNYFKQELEPLPQAGKPDF